MKHLVRNVRGRVSGDAAALLMGHVGIAIFLVSAVELKSPAVDYVGCWYAVGVSLVLFLAALTIGVMVEREANHPKRLEHGANKRRQARHGTA